MRNSVGKRLRKQAFKIASEEFQKNISIKIISGKQFIWEKNCPQFIYKQLKKDYYVS